MYDIAVIGSGPAGISAAITALVRGKSVAVVSNPASESGLYKAERIDNYPGLPAVSGAELSDAFISHARSLGAELFTGKVQTILPNDDTIFVGYGMEMFEARALIFAPGVVRTSAFPGERELLGLGVSYCATCDGMLYRGKEVCVVCLSPDAAEEAEYLRSIGCKVFTTDSKKIAIGGGDRVEWVEIDGQRRSCEGVFVLRDSVAPDVLIPGLELENKHVRVGASGETNIPGIFAAGDCTGTPYQIAKAVGEGQLAAFAAVKYLDALKTD